MSKRPISENNNRVLPMVLDQKIDVLQIPPTGVDFLWFLQKSMLIGTFIKKHDFSMFFELFKFQKVSKQPIFEKNNRVLPMVLVQKMIEILLV